MATDTLDTTERRNPDTPEFRAIVERSQLTLVFLKELVAERKAEAVAKGVEPRSLFEDFPTLESRKKAFEAWLDLRNERVMES